MKIRRLLFLAMFFSFLLGSLQAAEVPMQEAKQVGINFLSERIQLFSVDRQNSLEVNEVIVYEHEGLPVFYVFNFVGGGFIIVSADDILEPIIGYSYDGLYATELQSCCYKSFILELAEEASSAIVQNLSATPDVASKWQSLRLPDREIASPENRSEVEPLLTSVWNQDYPYNALCPVDPQGPGGHVYAGCVATAMSIVMHYYRYPIHGTGEKTHYSSYGPLYVNFGETYYDWDAMLDVVNTQSGSSIRAVAELQYHCGVAVNMQYSPNGSGAYSQTVPGALIQYFGFTGVSFVQRQHYSYANWKALLVAQLDNSHPMYYSGSGSGGGHAWNVDGYQVEADDIYFHMNFGWGGSANGYYSVSAINTNNGSFNNTQGAVINFFPPASQYPYHCSGGTRVITSHKGSFEDGSSPIANYLNNTSCSWLIAPHDSVNSITIDFKKFETLPDDIVTIYDGDSDDAPVLGTFSGSDLPPTVTSTGDRMFITFETGANGSAKGWLAEYSTQLPVYCSGIVQVTDPYGSFSDGSGEFNYNNNSLCRWFIQPPSAYDLTLSFTAFDTEPVKDYMQIYDISNNQLVAQLSGNEIPDPVTVASGRMLVVWRTSHFDTYPGWEAEWTIANVGIERHETFSGFSMYPNPANNVLNLSFAVTEMNDLSVSITSVTGQEVYREDIGRFMGKYMRAIDIGRFPSGVYMVTLTNSKASVTEKLIVE
jgi:hypothetical protein